jgi:hypothetical protein
MAEANQDPILTITEDEVATEYKVNDLSEEARLIYNKLAILQKQNQELVVNANFEVEKNEILQKHYIEQIKVHLPTKEEDEDKESDNDSEEATS